MYEVGACPPSEQLASRQALRLFVDNWRWAGVPFYLRTGKRLPKRASEVAIQFKDVPQVLFNAHPLRVASRFGRLMWALGKHMIRSRGGSLPDVLARAERDLPSGFFTLSSLERFIRLGLASRGRGNAFTELGRTLLIPAVDINTAERVVFGAGQLASVPISDAVAASSAIPGFFDPYGIDGRDYIDGGVGFSGHADLAAAAGADVVFVVNPLVPNRQNNGHSIGSRGVYTIMEQAGRIYSENLLQLGLASLAVKFPRTAFYLLQPARDTAHLFGPSMGFAASRAALRYGYSSTKAWLNEQGLRSSGAWRRSRRDLGALDARDGALRSGLGLALARRWMAPSPS
jgi:hypothetical protein